MSQRTKHLVTTLPMILVLVYLLLVGVGVIGDAFKWVSGGAEGAKKMFEFASNPIVGVIIGVLATAVVQSSSTITSVIVALVGSGAVEVSMAIPMIMGANMGTTITNTIVSFGNISEGPTFRKSFAAATVHDFFNFFSIVIFLPLELIFHPLQRIAEYSSGWFSTGNGVSGMSNLNFIKGATKPLQSIIVDLFQEDVVVGVEPNPQIFAKICLVILGITLVILSVLFMGKLLKRAMTSTMQNAINKAFGKGALMGVLYGTVLTILVQSSSTTTSLIVPLAGAGVLSLKQVFPFTLGANIGTCVTALLAATAVDSNADAALQIAIVHLVYNIAGVILFLSVGFLKKLPLYCADKLAEMSQKNRLWAFGYIFTVFFVLPGSVFLVQSTLDNSSEETEQHQTEIEELPIELE